MSNILTTVKTNVPITVDVQRARTDTFVPTDVQFTFWANGVLRPGNRDSYEIAVRVVDADEMRLLNGRFRDKHYATNVLSFPAQLPEGVDETLLGDIVICAAVVAREAAEQNKDLQAHWAHMLVHGVLHLMGYDHEQDDDSREMESLEIEVLARLGFANPYQCETELTAGSE